MSGKFPRKINTSPRLESAIDLGGQSAPVIVRVNRRARRLIVRVDARAGKVVVTAPSKRAIPEALAFARTRAGWIRRQFAEAEPAVPFAHGGSCPYRGTFHRIVNAGPARALVSRIDGPEPAILVGGSPEHVNRRLIDWLKREAQREVGAAVRRHCEKLRQSAKRIQVRDTRSRWGSCSADGVLSFSWRLILAPPWVLDYVAAHECAHLLHLDHSAHFWRTVAELGADADAARRWFRRNGAALHAFGAEPASLAA